MGQPNRQIEIQLGHLCNNRCVFCVSGQLSELKRAPQLPDEPIRRQLAKARESGAKKVTFLGGEPTIQRSFLPLLAYTVELDFDEIVIFTNGVMTTRGSFRDRTLAVLDKLGPRMAELVIWRFSLQGGTREAHDLTTTNPGAWDRIQQSMELVHQQGGRISGNMCVVTHNWQSVSSLAEVAARYELEDLHLDMFRPRDSGDRTKEYLRTLMTRYTEMAPAFRDLITGCDERLGPDYDVNIGNMPYCVAPDLAHKMHHDGEYTVTVAASGQGTTQEGFDKYTDKRSDKHKMPACEGCVFDAHCGGVFDLYAEFHGEDEFTTVTPEGLWQIDERGHHFVLLASDAIDAWSNADAGRRVTRIDERAGEIDVEVSVDGEPWRVVLRRAGRGGARTGWATLSGRRFEAALFDSPPGSASAIDALRDALGDLNRRLDGGDSAIDGFEGLPGAWRQAVLSGRRRAAAQARVRNNALALARGLQGVELAGLRQQETERTEDGRWIAVRFGQGSGHVTLSIGVEPGPDGGARPPLKHVAEGLDAERLAAFSQALGRHLRGRQRAASNQPGPR